MKSRFNPCVGFLTLIAVLCRAACGQIIPEIDIKPGSVTATPASIKQLVSKLGPGVYHRLSGCTPPPAWGTGSPADEAAAQLVRIGAPAVPYMLPLVTVKDEAERALVVEALGRIRGAPVFPTLVDALRSDTSDRVRESAAEALANMHDFASTDALIFGLSDSSTAVQWIAARALVEHPFKSAVKPLLALLEKEKGEDHQIAFGFHGGYPVAETAAEALGMIGPEAWPGIKQLYSDPDPRLHTFATKALSVCNDRRAIPDLISLTTSPDKSSRQMAASALSKWRDPRSVRALASLLNNGPVGDLRTTAAMSLASIGSPDALKELVKAYHSTDKTLRQSVLDSFWNLHARGATSFLLDIIKGDDKAAAIAALFTLGGWHEPRALPALFEMIRDSDMENRRAAAGILGQYKIPKVVGPLITALADPEELVRRQAVSALLGQEDPRIEPAVTLLLNDPSPDVRQCANIVLEALRKQAIAPAPRNESSR